MSQDQIQSGRKHKSRVFKIFLLLLPTIYFIGTFIRVLACQYGQPVCSMRDMAVVFPLYALVTSFVGELNFAWYVLLYFLSSLVYLAIFYDMTKWLEQLYGRFKYPPGFRLKRV